MTRQRRAIVIGTGAGGLSAAAYLAKDGFEVTALDQADRIGGFLAPFSLDGYTFDPGLHYVGQARRGQQLDRVLGGLGIDVEAAFVEMDPDGFDVYRFPGAEVRMCRGLERYRDRLVERFPDERDGWHRLFELIEHYRELAGRWPMGGRRPALSDLRGLRHLPSVVRWMHSSFAELLAHALHDPRARGVLAAPVGDAGLPPSELSALAGIGILSHYLDGGFYPRGGSGALRDALVEAATRSGAQFRTEAEVIEILVGRSAVEGVRLSSGEALAADVVIADIDPTITFGQLLARSDVPNRLRRKVERTEPSLATFSIYLGMKRDLRAHGLGAFNVWHFPTWDLEAVYAPALAGRIPDEPAWFLASSTSRDDSGRLAPAGCSTLQITINCPWQAFARWASLRPEARGDDYRALRGQLAYRLLADVERRWPGLVGDVAVQRVATPLSNTDYTRAVKGGIYGPAHTVNQMGPWRFGTRTPIHGLLLAGSGAISCGVVSCLASGRIAAAVAAGRRVRGERPVAASPSELAGAVHA
jgi:all-trans-retinol 13,14-reductase